ncbi:ATP-binding protein [Christiangramia flava]|uniref:histidine kinase n=1 Tax=Christiangramia flava JLT2011 TaxID=1229726 RepID=A0A1L7I0P8_9FLAO|nr:ATP-binding protein [Christiangramia flava]APU66774.1 Phytochrome, two-component sensor histidine kinase [Christiangramia flava JLT2011]OSS38411.1 Phytochrome, two-component sensor histidine kinase [Christiangramia flava JLT2011]
MSQNSQYPEEVDLSSCEKEPIHIIGKTQSHGVLVASDKETFRITQIGKNAGEIFGISHSELLGKQLEELVGSEYGQFLRNLVDEDELLEVREISIHDSSFVAIPHISGESLVVDFEPVGKSANSFNFQAQLTKILNNLNASETSLELCEDVARITKNIFGYDRVMVYRFDEEWNGQVVAEEREEHLESWLGLHYPASDIPKQARELFFKNRVRIISDVNYQPVEITPQFSPINGEPLDLSKSKLRGVSPIHIEYLQNMKVGASLTAALISNGKLWGLLACHHYSARFINYYQRQTCEFLIQIFSNELSLKESNLFLKQIDEQAAVREQLLKQVHSAGSIRKGLSEGEARFTDVMDCCGGAIMLKGKIKLVGKTPDKKQVKSLIKEFLAKKSESLFFTKNLIQFYPAAKRFQDSGSGILSVRLGQSDKDFLIWFRPEVVQLVDWGGNPQNKASYDEEKQRLTPRKSFEKWTQELTGVSAAWKDYDLSAARLLRESVSYVILENQKKEINDLNDQLVEAHNELELFSQGLSHDLKAPLRGIDGYAHILKEDYYSKLEKDGKLAVDTILSSAEEMRDLIDNILSFAGVSNQDLNKSVNSSSHMVQDILVSFNVKNNYPHTSIEIEENLPKIIGDRRMLGQVWSNLLANALKYSEKSENPKIEIGSAAHHNKTIYFVKDNGIGFDPKFSEDIFDLFSRRSGDDYTGSGIGLAIAKKIVEKHDGEIWAESKPGEGSTFYFYV